jgi:hypothetical protein
MTRELFASRDRPEARRRARRIERPRAPVRRDAGGGRWCADAIRRAAPSGRETAVHNAAGNGCTQFAVRLLVGGADQSIPNKNGHAAARSPAMAAHRIGPNRRRETPRERAQARDTIAAYDAAVAEVRPHVHPLILTACHACNAEAAFFGVRRGIRAAGCASRTARDPPVSSHGRRPCGCTPLCCSERGGAAHAAVVARDALLRAHSAVRVRCCSSNG